jgi:hypothetical protein
LRKHNFLPPRCQGPVEAERGAQDVVSDLARRPTRPLHLPFSLSKNMLRVARTTSLFYCRNKCTKEVKLLSTEESVCGGGACVRGSRQRIWPRFHAIVRYSCEVGASTHIKHHSLFVTRQWCLVWLCDVSTPSQDTRLLAHAAALVSCDLPCQQTCRAACALQC